MMKAKVFCLGFHKTGTTSLGVALAALGYRVTGPTRVNDPNIEFNALSMALRLANKYDAFQDNPWPILYPELDARYPGSKFILMLRNSKAWIQSQVKHFGRKETAMRKWIYGVGCPEGHEDIYLKRFEEHNTKVQCYFKDRPGDLLVMNLANGDGWDKLCPFLGVDVPDIAFPHANKASDRNAFKVTRAFKRMNKFVSRLAWRLTAKRAGNSAER
jgi:hypothetical protein